MSDAPEVDTAAMRAAVATIEANGKDCAKKLLSAAAEKRDKDSLLLLAESAAASAAVASHLVDDGCVTTLLPHLTPAGTSKQDAELALRLFSAISTHADLSER